VDISNDKRDIRSDPNWRSAVNFVRTFWIGLLVLFGALTAASAQSTIKGQVLGAGAPIANATVTLWAASAGAPAQLGRLLEWLPFRWPLRPFRDVHRACG
jgi:hypothetical protein